jgi:hypothetical protein
LPPREDGLVSASGDVGHSEVDGDDGNGRRRLVFGLKVPVIDIDRISLRSKKSFQPVN